MVVGSVFCVSVDGQSCSMVVSGGEDDRAFVWRVGSGEVIMECAGQTSIYYLQTTVLICLGDTSDIHVCAFEPRASSQTFSLPYN